MGLTFRSAQRKAQAGFLQARCEQWDFLPGSDCRLNNHLINLAPEIRPAVEELTGAITWHRHLNHGLSSQACCLNFLLPLAGRPHALARVMGRALGIEAPLMLPVDDKSALGERFVAFEWTDPGNLLGEWSSGQPTPRGANATCADAMVRFRHAGREEVVLIEWKYTESYGQRLPDRRRRNGVSGGNLTRAQRYAHKMFWPNGPLSPDAGVELKAFFWEPFYQLLRQQMLVWHMEQATGLRTRVLHISPSGNTALHRVTSESISKATGHTDAFLAFESMLVKPEDGVPRFSARSIEEVFGAELAASHDEPWARYLLDRYAFVAG